MTGALRANIGFSAASHLGLTKQWDDPVRQTFERKIISVLTYVFWCSKGLCSFQYPQHIFWLRNKKINF